MPAASWEFPTIAYHLDGTLINQGKDEDGHTWWGDCDCEACFENAQEREIELELERERGPKPKHKKKKKSSQQKLRERYEAGDPEVDLLGEPSGKFDYYVLYSRSKPSFSTTPMMTPEPSWSDTPKSDSVAREDDSWEEGLDPLMIERKADIGRL